MSAWITDRVPTREDAGHTTMVWVSSPREVYPCDYSVVSLGQPWQPITYPEPYQKPKVWGWGENTNHYAKITKNGEDCVLIHFIDGVTPAHIDAIVDALNRLEDSHD